MRGTASRVAMIGAFASLMVFTVSQADARGGGRGGGGGFSRGGGSASMSRGGGGGGFNRGGGGGGGMNASGFSRGGNYSGPSGAGNRPSQLPAQGGNRGNINTGNVNRGNINTGNINRGNINTGNINTGNVNVNRGNVNVNVDNRYGYGGYGCCHGWYDYPTGGWAAGAVAGAVVGSAVTAAAIGSRYYALPTGCSPYPYSGYTYYSCGSVWYKPTYQGDTVVYVVVNKPY